jgi:HTH-type transcriptional regulator/antitoxin HipB
MDPPLAKHFGRTLRRARRRAGLTQGELGRLAELHRGEIGKLEGGQRLAKLDTILKLAAGVDASACVLLAGLRWRPGYYVEGDFYVEDGAGWAAGTEKAAGHQPR